MNDHKIGDDTGNYEPYPYPFTVRPVEVETTINGCSLPLEPLSVLGELTEIKNLLKQILDKI